MKIRFEPSGVTTDATTDTTLLQAAIAAGVEIEAVCGGRGTCAKCRVLASGGLSPLAELERQALSETDLSQGYRLACQTYPTDDVDVVIPVESRISRVAILEEGSDRTHALDPWVTRRTMTVPEPSLEHQVADLDRLSAVWPDGQVLPPFTLGALRQLPGALREQEGLITLLLADGEIISVRAGNGPARLLGLAYDIGTTTVVGYLLDLESGEELGVASRLNPQTRYGDDVVSRIEHSAKPGGMDDLQAAVIGAINDIAAEAVAEASETTKESISVADILALVAVGNTTMHHLLLGINPQALAQSPYVPVTTPAIWVHAHDLGINISPDAHVWMLPNIAGWVGADTVGVILSSGLYCRDELGLAIDIGTNGEMALGAKGRLLTCSTAAGPAFEGAQLSCGMRAADGAIDYVTINDDVHWHAIGDAEPRGVCGSGLVDTIAQMLDAGVLTSSGRMQRAEVLERQDKPKLAERIVPVDHHRDFRLVHPAEGAGGREILVTQRDIRELQLAKGAIRAGIETLMDELGITREDVRVVYMAGAFGNYIQPASALTIGLMPTFPNAKIRPIGNAAGTGARMALLSATERQHATDILGHVEYLELSGRPDFQERFAEAMLF